MKLLLPSWLPYASSAAIHAVAWGTCCLSAGSWFTNPELQLSQQRGDAMDTMLIIGSAAASPEPSVESDVQSPDGPAELAETPVPVSFDASPAPAGAELSAADIVQEKAATQTPPARADVSATADLQLD